VSAENNLWPTPTGTAIKVRAPLGKCQRWPWSIPNVWQKMNLLLRGVSIWFLIAAAETLHGIARLRILNRRFGDKRARQIGVGTGSIIILALAWLTIPWLGVRTVGDAFAVGLLWFVLMICFDLGLGRFVFRFSWDRLLAEFDPRKGGFLALGMIVLGLAPFLAAIARGLLR